jgi:hypothetical protein
LTYSQKIAENISLGSTLRYIHSSPGPKVNLSGQLIRPISSVGGDIGVYYTTRSSFRGVDDANDGSINLGLAIRNLGSKITYYDGSRSTQQPTLVVGGITYHFPSDGENRISLSGEAGKTLQTGAQVSGGFEYGYRNMFYARAGIHYEPKQWSAQQLYTFGVGIKTEILDFDISYYQPFSKLENPAYGQILKIGFSFNFIDGKIIGGRYD